ncbi:DDHD domain-containing protein [Exophiala viscosa]|uniref:DDHD domain-containing protein n=1 Tax=Exophiala viscosa TaxID=2486360 RepID=UPI0021A2432B|nr:DDHD domain-containing protein [Exophiala viscosa]
MCVSRRRHRRHHHGRLKPTESESLFFYVSSLPIDDPLSPLPPIPTAEKITDFPPKPFSVRDNAALEEAWQSFQDGGPGSLTDPHAKRRRNLARGVISFPEFKDSKGTPATQPLATRSGNAGKTPGRASAEPTQAEAEVMLDPVPLELSADSKTVDMQELQTPQDDMPPKASTKHKRRMSPFRHRHKDGKSGRDTSAPSKNSDRGRLVPSPSFAPVDSAISGRPFARAPSARDVSSGLGTTGGYATSSDAEDEDSSTDISQSRSPGHHRRKEKEPEKVFVPVGVSRLHLVEMPDLIMKPIYWSPINDTSDVLRATWFYKDTMLPVPADVANRLEVGYEYIKPYAKSYQDEFQACIENGASAEMKVVYKLWPDDSKSSRPGTSMNLEADTKVGGQEELSGMIPETAANVAADPRKAKDKRLFSTHSVIYVDGKNAQILRPSLLPSTSQNRRPLSSVRKGRQIGVAVVRGFDRKAWLKAHPDPKMNAKAAHAKVGAYMSQSGDAATRGRRTSCSACEQESKAPKVSDLVLVIHGIGQKLSERVDSFHFTHAINGLRREFNVELSTEAVKGNTKNGTGVMVLPVNWRLTVSFDDDDKSLREEDNKFALKDITPETLPSVRSLITDVMLDIPYYMSHHKAKMTSAVVREANRVYRLWCRNNPGFEDYGRVHLVAHSLGSVMAMEILGQQPTKLGKDVTFDGNKPSDKYFEFDTTNLFCCGSPGGFFLLLNNASLIPRKGRNKVGMEGEDKTPGIASEARYGCLAVDNVYNICHRNDPISYLQNASVDQLYAASLQPASIPSASVGFMTRLGNSLRWGSTATSSDSYKSVATPARPELQHIPSTVELETHNFTREEIAEKRMYLLNDNGQIDWFLNSGGGPLEIQYLNMLSAHSSYWILQDFVRFLVVEIGREPGRQHTLPVLRAVKKREYKRGDIV